MLGFPLGILSAAGAEVGVAGAYELIATEILTANTPSVTFSSLATYASTYKHLQIRMVARTTNATQQVIALTFNGDSGLFYALHRLSGNGSSVVSAANPSQPSVHAGLIPGSGAAANAFGASVLEILDVYSATKNTTTRSMAGQPAQPEISFQSGAYFKTDAVSSIELFVGANFVAGSRFSLYGIKG